MLIKCWGSEKLSFKNSNILSTSHVKKKGDSYEAGKKLIQTQSFHPSSLIYWDIVQPSM